MTDRIEIKAQLTVDDAGTITGLAWPFGSPDRVGDVIEPKAFQSGIGKIPMLWAHDQAQTVGVWDSVVETEKGLEVRGRLLVNDVARAKEVRALIMEQAVSGLSIGFVTKKATARSGGGRTISSLELLEVSIVAVPAHPAAQITSLKAVGDPATPRKNEMENDIVVAPAIDTKALDKVVARLEQVEAKLNRPAIITADNAVSDERKAFVEFARKGVERMEQKAVAALTVSTDSQGGYLAPEEVGSEILKSLVEFSPIRQYAKVITIGGSEIKLPRRLTGTVASWVAEIADRAQSDQTYEQATFTPYELATFVDVSTQLLEDNAYNLEGELTADFAESFGKAEGTAFVSGDGSGKPKGLMAATGITTINSGVAATLGTDPAGLLMTLYHKLPTAFAQNGVWLMNRTTLGTLRQLKDTTGRFLLADPISAGMPTTILGRPVVEAVDMDDVGAAKFPIMFGDLSGYRIVDRIGLSVLRDPFSLATKGQVRFHARRRVGADVTHADRFAKIKCSV
jgi:HK97 family phage major capsid protein/HK97 family phage prohead protease